MNQLYDPTANCKVDESTVLKLNPTGGYQPCLSPKSGKWFAIQTWINTPCTLEQVAEHHRDNVQAVIDRYELIEEVSARVEMMRAEGEAPTIAVEESKDGLDHLSRIMLVSACRSRGYTMEEIKHALATRERLQELADATLGAQRVTLSDNVTVEAHEEEGGDDEAR